MLRWATHEQVGVVGLNGEVDYLQPFVTCYLLDDFFDVARDRSGQYRTTALRQPHYVVVEVISRVPCGLHPYTHYAPEHY